MHLRLHFFKLPVGAHEGRVNFIIEVTNVTYDCTFLNGFQHIGIAHVSVTGRGYNNISRAHQAGVNATDVARVNTF